MPGSVRDRYNLCRLHPLLGIRHPYGLSHFLLMIRLSAVFLKLLPAGMRAPPATRVAT
jgi:hypothetical protein